jgi:acetyl-CoA synthetase
MSKYSLASLEKGEADMVDYDSYQAAYERSVSNPDGFWREEAGHLAWMEPFTKVKDTSFDADDFRIRWFEDGVINVSANCIDRHLTERGHQLALIWEGDAPGETRRFTYIELHEEVCRFANVLKGQGVAKGDRVTIYMPNMPEAAFAMLACTRIGAIHSTVFGGFSPESLRGRIEDCGSAVVITADEAVRGGKSIPLKTNVDAALRDCNFVRSVIVASRTGADIPMTPGRDHAYAELRAAVSGHCEPTPMGAEDPLFILYTSGSTGKPKGVLHTTAGYLLWVARTFHYLFGQKPGDIFWCTADVGWITGHSYLVYGPLANGVTTVMFDGVPSYPDPGRFWETCDRLGVNVLYTAPTVLRALMREGDHWVTQHNRSSLRLLGSVGEPINPEAWEWYYRVVGDERCPIVDTWWQTETGGAMIAPIPGAVALKPGSATKPMFGVQPILLNEQGEELYGPSEGNLCISQSWPGQMRGIWGDPDRFFQTYFTTFPGHYFTGDGCRRDEDGYYWITGRVDDVINVSGHRIGTAEVESAIGSHVAVAEAAVVGVSHDIKGQGIYAFVTLKSGEIFSDELRSELRRHVRSKIGPIASLDAIQCAQSLPKTRSGKIMRRILRKIAENEIEQLGDTSTLSDPGILVELIAQRLSVTGK